MSETVTENNIKSNDFTRRILCRNCDLWKQEPNPEIGLCTFKEDEDDEPLNNSTNYDSRCILGLSEIVNVPEVEVKLIEI